MDLRTGQTYDTKQAALDAGVPESDIAEIQEGRSDLPDVRFTSGPFKNRVYKRLANGQLVRVGGGRWIEKSDGHGNPIKVRA